MTVRWIMRTSKIPFDIRTSGRVRSALPRVRRRRIRETPIRLLPARYHGATNVRSPGAVDADAAARAGVAAAASAGTLHPAAGCAILRGPLPKTAATTTGGVMPIFRPPAARAPRDRRGRSLTLCAPMAPAADLTVGLGTDVTAIDPHYHNLTPNNNVAAHLFGYLVQRNEKSQLEPGLATEWKTIDPLTWEFKLRRGVKFHDGSDFTAADVVASIERVPTVPNSPSPFTAYTKQIKEMIVVDPYTIRFRTAAPYPLMPSDMTQVVMISKSAAKASTDDFNSGKAAIGTGPYKLVRYAKSDRIELARNDAYWGGRTPWEKVTLRLLPQDAARVAALLSGDVQVIENVPTSDAAQLKKDKRLHGVPHGRRPAHLPAHGQRSRRLAVRHRQGRKAAREEPAQGSARAPCDLEGDQPPGDRREGHGGRGDRGGTARPRFPVRRVEEPQGRGVRSRRREEAPVGSRLSGRLRPHDPRAEQPLRQRREDRAGGRADAEPRRHRHQGRRDAVGDVLHAGDRSQVQLHAARLEHRHRRSRRRR